MQFSSVTLTVDGASVVFNPYDRGASGSFVYRMAGVTLQAPRLVVSTNTDDNTSDKYLLQNNVPYVRPAEEGCCTVNEILGTDVVKTELRFLATTTEADRTKHIDTHIAVLQEFRETFEKREKLYS